ncbi:hypothetical protein Tco_1296258 [Tanacetum coccineum]
MGKTHQVMARTQGPPPSPDFAGLCSPKYLCNYPRGSCHCHTQQCQNTTRTVYLYSVSAGECSPIRLNFDEDGGDTGTRTIMMRKEIKDADLKKPFQETEKTLFIRRIIEFAGPEFKIPANIKLYDETTDPEDHLSRFALAANSKEWHMPVWCRMFQQTLDGNVKGWFECLPAGSIDEWVKHRKQFTTRFSTRRACFKDLTEITKTVRNANETLVAFKERWTIETVFILDVLEIMKISSFMDAHKCPEQAKRYSDKVPKTVDEMIVRLDDFGRSCSLPASCPLSSTKRRSSGEPPPQAQSELAYQAPQRDSGFETSTKLTTT